eukprot:s421_g17.t2
MWRRALVPLLSRRGARGAFGALGPAASAAAVAQSSKASSRPGLIELIKSNRETDAEAVLHEIEDVNDLDQFGSTPLILAAQRDWAQVVKELLQRRDVDPNHQNLFGSTALICAAANGYLSTMEELLLDDRVDLEVLFGHMNTTERLLQAGAQAQVTNKMGQKIMDVAKEEHKDVLLKLFGRIVRGNFTANGQNHGRPTYRKDQQVNGLDVMLYYWDERDGPNFCGWWFGPKVGGDQVWAYHNSRSAMTPPTRGWKVPYDGPVDDTFSIGPVGAAPQAALPPAPMPPQPQVPGFPGAMPGSRQEQQAQMRLQHEQQRALQQQRIKEQEELKAKQQEMAARREEQARLAAERKQKEQEAATMIRVACQKIHIAKDETFQQAEQELYQTMQLQLPNCGFMMPKIREECEQVLLQAKKRLEDMARQKAIDEERKARMTEQAEKLVDDFNIKVAAAEEAAKMLTEKAESLTTIDTILQMSEEEIEEQNQVIQEAHKEANDRIKICHDYLQEYFMHMRVPDSPGQPPAPVNVSLQKISERLTATTTDKDAILVKCSNCRKMAEKKKEAQKVMEGISAKFKSYDSNRDGFLDKKEIIAYSKKEFKFPLADKDVTKILKALQVGAKGVPESDFQKLKVRIGCLREKVLDDARRKKREAHELELEGYKELGPWLVDEFKAKLTKLDEGTESVEAEVKKVEDSMGEVKADTLKSFELKILVVGVLYPQHIPKFRRPHGPAWSWPMATPVQLEINRRLTAWDATAQGILQVVQRDLEKFNLVNCTTALHRYAKAVHGHGQSKNEPQLKRLLTRTAEVVQKAKGKVPAQNLANALWAMERLQLTASEGAVCAVAWQTREALQWFLWSFTGQNLANVAWAVAKLLSGRDAEKLLEVAQVPSKQSFFDPFLAALEQRAADLNAQELSMAAWSAAGFGGDDAKAMLRVLQVLGEAAQYLGLHELSAQQLATFSWAFAKAGLRSQAVESILKDIARAAAPKVARGDFNVQDLSNIAWAFGRLQLVAPELLKALAQILPHHFSSRSKPSHGGFSPQQLALLSWSLARMGGKEELKTLVEALLPRLSELSPRDVTDVVWALGHAGVRHDEFLQKAGGFASAHQGDFGTQEMLRFLGAFRRAGGEGQLLAEMASKQQQLHYDFPALQLEVKLHAETPGQQHRRRRRVRASALRESEELGGDPQRADGGTTGVALWEASFVLAEWLSRHGDAAGGLAASRAFQELMKDSAPKRWRWAKKRGVELGAGLGLPAIVAARLGAEVVATDGDACVMKLLRRNVEDNGGANLRAEALLWGAEDPLGKLGLSSPVDFLLAADVVYASAKEALNKQLLETMLKLTHPDSVVILSNVRRFHESHKGEGRFLSEADKLFWRCSVQQTELHVDFQRSGVGSCVIHLLRRRSARSERSVRRERPAQMDQAQITAGTKKVSRSTKKSAVKRAAPPVSEVTLKKKKRYSSKKSDFKGQEKTPEKRQQLCSRQWWGDVEKMGASVMSYVHKRCQTGELGPNYLGALPVTVLFSDCISCRSIGLLHIAFDFAATFGLSPALLRFLHKFDIVLVVEAKHSWIDTCVSGTSLLWCLLRTITPSKRRRQRRQRAQARLKWHLHRRGHLRLENQQLLKLIHTLRGHHSRDPRLIQRIKEEMAGNTREGKEPWRCVYCKGLNKMVATHCGSCETRWDKCIDIHYVHGQRGRKDAGHTYTNWGEEHWNVAQEGTERSTSRRRGGTPRSRKDSPRQRTQPKGGGKGKETKTSPFQPLGGAAPTAPWPTSETSFSSTSLNLHATPFAPQTPLVPAPTTQVAPTPDAELVKAVKGLYPDISKAPQDIRAAVEKAEKSNIKMIGADLQRASDRVKKATNKLQDLKASQSKHKDSWKKHLQEAISCWEGQVQSYVSQQNSYRELMHTARSELQTARQDVQRLNHLAAGPSAAVQPLRVDLTEPDEIAIDDTDSVALMDRLQTVLHRCAQMVLTPERPPIRRAVSVHSVPSEGPPEANAEVEMTIPASKRPRSREPGEEATSDALLHGSGVPSS